MGTTKAADWRVTWKHLNLGIVSHAFWSGDITFHEGSGELDCDGSFKVRQHFALKFRTQIGQGRPLPADHSSKIKCLTLFARGRLILLGFLHWNGKTSNPPQSNSLSDIVSYWVNLLPVVLFHWVKYFEKLYSHHPSNGESRTWLWTTNMKVCLTAKLLKDPIVRYSSQTNYVECHCSLKPK